MPKPHTWTFLLMWWTLPAGVVCAAVWLLFSAWWLIGGESLQPLSLISWIVSLVAIASVIWNGALFRLRVRAHDAAAGPGR